jgi:hypothetical protein
MNDTACPAVAQSGFAVSEPYLAPVLVMLSMLFQYLLKDDRFQRLVRLRDKVKRPCSKQRARMLRSLQDEVKLMERHLIEMRTIMDTQRSSEDKTPPPTAADVLAVSVDV